MKIHINYKEFIDKLKEMFDKGDWISCSNSHFFKLQSINDFDKVELTTIRPTEPIKIFLFQYRSNIIENIKKNKTLFLLGVKNCDLQAIKVLDKMFISEYIDENYKNLRESIIIFSSDCPKPNQTCFCAILNSKPYIDNESYSTDINISFIDEKNLILESFSEKGEEILKNYFSNFAQPTKTDFEKRDSIRDFALKKILEFNNEFLKEEKKEKYYKTLKNTYELDNVWQKESEKCVQCGGCNFICPSCYCFLIREYSKSYNEKNRDRVWDVCHFTGYSRVAGGANPRKYKYQRFRNRYQCKFVYRYENFNFYACTGCGRCIEVCPAKIDIRKVIRNLLLAKGEEILV